MSLRWDRNVPETKVPLAQLLLAQTFLKCNMQTFIWDFNLEMLIRETRDIRFPPFVSRWTTKAREKEFFSSIIPGLYSHMLFLERQLTGYRSKDLESNHQHQASNERTREGRDDDKLKVYRLRKLMAIKYRAWIDTIGKFLQDKQKKTNNPKKWSNR